MAIEKKTAKTKDDAIYLNNFVASSNANMSGLKSSGGAFGSSEGSQLRPVSGYEVPREFAAIGKLANDYYRYVGPAKTSINTWVSFAVGDRVYPTTSDKPTQNALDNFSRRVNMDDFVKDMTKQLLIKGEFIGYAMHDTVTGLKTFQTVNPVSCEIHYNDDGELIGITQQKRDQNGSPVGDAQPLNMRNTIYAKWDSPSFEDRGTSMLLAAFEDCAILRAYKRADHANANRWATPFRHIKLGGELGGKAYLPDGSAIESMVERINAMNPEAGIVTNCLVQEVTDWPKGNPDSNEKIEQLKHDIFVDCGLSRTVVTGEGANYATARIAMDKFVTDLGTLQGYVEKLIEWCISFWSFGPQVVWSANLPKMDLADKTVMQELLLKLYDRGMVSRKTVQVVCDLDPEAEDQTLVEQISPPASADTNMTPTEVANMVALNIITPEEARKLLGFDAPIDQAAQDEQIGVAFYKSVDKK